RGRGGREGRERLHRTEREAAPDGIRHRDEPSPHAADAGRYRVTVPAPTQPLVPLDRETVERLSVGRGEPDWLREHRLRALDRYERAQWPAGQEEERRRFALKDLPHAPIAALLHTKH